MRRVCELALLALCLACTDGGPSPASFELVESEPRFEAHAGFEYQPERERLIDPASQPRLELVAREVDPESEACPYDVVARGFPAVTEDGTTLVDVSSHGAPNGDFDDGLELELTWLDPDATRVDQIYARDDDDRDGCEQARQLAGLRVATLNARLARHAWSPLERLDAFYSQPGWLEYHGNLTGEEDEALATLTGEQRPVEVFYRNGHFIARVRAMKVLQDVPRPKWQQHDDEFCLTDAQISSVEFDPRTKVALVRYNYSSGGCLCDDRGYVARIELTDAVVAEAARRSTKRLVEAVGELVASDC